MTWLLLNLLVAAPFFAIWVGVPLWLVLKHPDQDAPGRRRQAAQPTGTRVSRWHRNSALIPLTRQATVGRAAE